MNSYNKLLLFLLVLIPQALFAQSTKSIVIDSAHFPDSGFRTYLKEQDYGKDGVITEEEIKKVNSISIFSRDIVSLKGIEYFTALTELSCSSNNLISFDISKNTALVELYCSYCKLTSLDISKNTALKKLVCSENQLSSLDLSHNVELEELDCSWNNLTVLDVSKNTKIKGIACYMNHISGSNMDVLIGSLPYNFSGKYYKIYLLYNGSQFRDYTNLCTEAQVAKARKKGWIPYYYSMMDEEYFEYYWDFHGDVNNDGRVSIIDAVLIVNYILGYKPKDFNEDVADIDGSGNITVFDAVCVINIILERSSSDSGTRQLARDVLCPQ